MLRTNKEKRWSDKGLDNFSKIFYEKVVYGYSNIVKERGIILFKLMETMKLKKFSARYRISARVRRFKSEHHRLRVFEY